MAKIQNNLIHEGTPVIFTNIKGSTDKELINPELSGIDVLSKIQNLTPFRKAGSLVLCPSQLSLFTNAQLPTPSGYILSKVYIFSVDRSTEDIYMLIYQNASNEVKIFIKKYWNPDVAYSNYNACQPYSELNKTTVQPAISDSWVNAWLELTEYYSATLDGSHYADLYNVNIAHASTAPLNWEGYFKGWFIVNENESRSNRFGFITASTLNGSYNKLTLQGTQASWGEGDRIKLIRFPVVYSYYWDIANLGRLFKTFDALPTDFIYRENQLRMPCGKEKRPLILDFINKRKFFYAPTYSLGKNVSKLTLLTDGDYSTSASYPQTVTVAITGGGGTGATGEIRMGIGIGAHVPTYSSWKSGSAAPDGYYNGINLTVKSGEDIGTVYTYPNVMVKVTMGIPSIVEVYEKGKFTKYSRKAGILEANVTAGGVTYTAYFTAGTWDATDIVLTNGGQDFTSAPSVAITGSGAPEATASAEVAELSLANGEMWYDGFWFDFQQLPQCLSESAVTSFDYPFATTTDVAYLTLESVVYSGTTYYYVAVTTDPVPANYLARISALSGTTGIIISNRKGQLWSDLVGQTAHRYLADGTKYDGAIHSTSQIAVIWAVAGSGRDDIFVKGHGDITITPTAWATILRDIALHGSKPIAVSVGNISSTASMPDGEWTFSRTITYRSSTSGMMEAENRKVATNKFIDSQVQVFKLESGTASRNAFIVTAVYDNRDEIIIAQGMVAVLNTGLNATEDLLVKFGTWFSRRLTGFKVYMKVVDDTFDVTDLSNGTVSSAIVKIPSNKYPYFTWVRYIRKKDNTDTDRININEIPLFKVYSLYDINLPENGETPYKIAQAGERTNCFRYYRTTGQFISSFNRAVTDFHQNGRGLKFVVSANRFIDQDVTMNYTKGTFVGQTNGRYFLVGCKNTVENEVLESDDMIFPNLYATGISEYDIILRNSNVNVFLGNKDTITTITNYGGYLTVIKKGNIYTLDVNTEDELRYRVVDTMMNRGTDKGDSIGILPYGIVIPLSDGVFLMSPDGITPLLTGENGNLYRYMTAFSSATSITTVFYNAYNELMICMAGGSESAYETLAFVYNFNYKRWTVYKYDACITQVLVDGDKKVIMLQDNRLSGADRKFNLVYLSENTVNTSNAVFLPPSNTSAGIVGLLETHFLPFGERVYDVRIPSITATYDYNSTAETTLKFTLSGNSDVTLSARTITLASAGSNIKYNRLKDMNMLIADAGTVLSSINMSTMVKLKLETTGKFDYLSINSIVLWLKIDNRVRQLT